ncbi:MAG: ATP-binding protein [Henriciella sp.]|nr:ATP-binding protein [Henriciella sp.]
MAKAEQIKALIASHLERDDEHFVTVALQLAANEARRGHSVLAQDIRKLIDSRSKRNMKVVSGSGDLDDLVSSESTGEHLSSLVLSSDLTSKIDRIVQEFHQAEKLAKHGLDNRRKILLSGPPGTGKTMTAAVLAERTKLPFFAVQIDRLVTKYLGETSAKLRQIFSMIRERPGVYLFDEFDAIGTQRGSDNDVGEMRRVLNALLQFIEGDESSSLIVAATNSLSSLDIALFRRFDDVLHYGKPEAPQIEALVSNRLNVFLGDYSLNPVVRAAKGLSHAEITQACDDAIKDAVLSDQDKVKQKTIVAMLADRKAAYSRAL